MADALQERIARIAKQRPPITEVAAKIRREQWDVEGYGVVMFCPPQSVEELRLHWPRYRGRGLLIPPL